MLIMDFRRRATGPLYKIFQSMALLPGVIGLICLVIGSAEFSKTQKRVSDRIDNTLEILHNAAILKADLAVLLLTDQESSTQDADKNSKAQPILFEVLSSLRNLLELSKNSPQRPTTLLQLQPLIEQQLAQLRRVSTSLSVDMSAVLPDVDNEVHDRLINKIIPIINEVSFIEGGSLSKQKAALDRIVKLTLIDLITSLLVVSLSSTLSLALLIARDHRREQENIANFKALNESLDEQVRTRTAELAASVARQQTYVRHLADGLLAIRAESNGSFVYESVNAAACEMLGLDRSVIGWNTNNIVLEGSFGITTLHLQQAVALSQVVKYNTIRQTSDRRFDLRIVIAPVLGAIGSEGSNHITLLLVSVRDMTYETTLEAQVRQVQRMEAVGQLTAGIAHDFNNLLQVILGSLEILRDQLGLDAEGRECAALAESAAQRGATLVHRLLAFSRKQPLSPTFLRPNLVIENVGSLLERTIGSRIRVVYFVPKHVGSIKADGPQLDNCLYNIALNARDAMPQGGILNLAADIASPQIVEEASLPAGDYVCFSIRDNGTGMTQETLARALEPFFTTKEVGKGTGLGLSMVQGFARQSGGDVVIWSEPGHGTEVNLLLPCVKASVLEEFSEAPDRGADSDRVRVLVVDDEDLVRSTLAMFLSKAGFNPVLTESGEAALKLFRADETYDLLITDQSMPGMTGCELISEVSRVKPAQKSMLITGYDRVSGLEDLPGRVTVMRKPFGRDDFIRQVEALLGS